MRKQAKNLLLRSSLLLLALVFASSLSAQKGDYPKFGLGFSLGFNSPIIDDNNGTESKVYLDEWGFPRPGTSTTTGQMGVPPLSLDIDLYFSKRFSLGYCTNYQSFNEKVVLKASPSGTYVSEQNQTMEVVSGIANLKFFWLYKPKFSLGSGFGAGYSALSTKNEDGNGNVSFCYDLRPIIFRYALWCGWALQAEARFTTAPTGMDKLAGYNFGVGVVYVFNSN